MAQDWPHRADKAEPVVGMRIKGGGRPLKMNPARLIYSNCRPGLLASPRHVADKREPVREPPASPIRKPVYHQDIRTRAYQKATHMPHEIGVAPRDIIIIVTNGDDIGG